MKLVLPQGKFCLSNMSELRKLIKVADLEQKMEMIFFNGRGSLNEICDECNGLMIVHREG